MALGISEFFFIGMIEFFYQQAPERMRSLAAALELVSFGIASFIASAKPLPPYVPRLFLGIQ